LKRSIQGLVGFGTKTTRRGGTKVEATKAHLFYGGGTMCFVCNLSSKALLRVTDDDRSYMRSE